MKHRSKTYILPIALLLTIATITCAQTQEQENILDSLRKIYHNSHDYTTKLEAIDAITYRHYNADSTEYYAKQQIELAKRIGNRYYEAKALDYLAWASFFYGDYPKSCEYTFEALIIADSIGDSGLKGNNFFLLGNAYSKLQNHIKSNEYFYQALDIYYDRKDSSHICDVLRNIAGNNYENSMYDAAEECLAQSKNINILRGDKIGLAEDNYYIGRLAYKRYEDHKIADNDISILKYAKRKLLESRNYAIDAQFGFSQLKANQQLALVMVELAEHEKNIRNRQQQLDSCEMLISEAYDLCDKIGNYNERLSLDETYTYWLLGKRRYKTAESYIDSLCNVLGKDSISIRNGYLQQMYLAKAKLYDQTGQHDKASHYKDLYHEMYHNSKQVDYVAQTAQNMAQANYDQKLRERELRYQTETKMQKTITMAVVVVLILAIMATFVVVISYLKSRKMNQVLDIKNSILENHRNEIEKQKHDLEHQNDIITSANKEMTASINYASMIQRAVMPSSEQMEALFGTNMIVYRPLDIVSGDFYWASQVGRWRLIAVADCTGHGVPGALLSMLGISTLNDIANRINENELATSHILDEMRTTIKHSLKQYGGDEDNHDGIDMVLVAIDTEKMQMHYSGAYRPALIVRDGEEIAMQYDRMPVGTHYKEANHFTERTLDIKQGDVLYMYTDGITDQFGYDEKHEVIKFGIARLHSLLKNIYMQPLNIQQTMIEMAIDSWRSDENQMKQYSQTDDALLVGIKI